MKPKKKLLSSPHLWARLKKIVRKSQLDFQLILNELDDLLEEHPSYSDGWLLKAQSHLALGQRQLARRALRNLERLNPKNLIAPFEKAELFNGLAQPKKAAEMLETGINGYLQELTEHLQLFNTDGLPKAAFSSLLARTLEEQARGTVKRATSMKLRRHLILFCKNESHFAEKPKRVIRRK